MRAANADSAAQKLSDLISRASEIFEKKKFTSGNSELPRRLVCSDEKKMDPSLCVHYRFPCMHSLSYPLDQCCVHHSSLPRLQRLLQRSLS